MDDLESAIEAETPRDHELLKRQLWGYRLDPNWPKSLFHPIEIPLEPSDDKLREIIVAYIEGVWSGRNSWQPAWVMINRDFENSNTFISNKGSFEALIKEKVFHISDHQHFFDRLKADMVAEGWWADPSFKNLPNDNVEAWAEIGKLLVLREFQRIIDRRNPEAKYKNTQSPAKNRKRQIAKTELAFHILNLISGVPSLSVSKACALIQNFSVDANGYDSITAFKTRYPVFRSSLKRVRDYVSEGKQESENSFIQGRII